MTITYTGRVANARLCAFSCLLFHWKGSIYKLMYKEMAIFCTLYATISAIYRLALNSEQMRTFEKIALYCETFINLIPLSFVLGFYVALVVSRWWNQYTSIPWPDRVMVYVSTMIEGNDEHGRLIRRTLMRYLALGSLIVFQATSVRVKKRFPTFDHLIEAGIASRAEIQALDDVSTPHGKWWIPFVWCCNLVKQARKQGRIADNYLLKSLIDEISAYRGNLGMLYSYDWISVPLVYTQVTTLAVYTFFLGCVFGRQYLDPTQNYPGHNIDLYIPFFTLLQFFFYMGWLKVAEQLINPFGEDDDDFEMNWIIDRNMQVSLLTTDDLYGQIPPIEKDLYFGEPPPDYLPYTKSSIKGMSQPHMGSTVDIRVSDEGMKVLSPLETIQEGVALGNGPYISSYLNTPRRNTPMASPHLGHYHNQNLMSGMLSPTDIRSRLSLRSCDKDTEEGSITTGGQSIISRATEKLGKWLVDHSSRTDLNRNLHSTFVGIVSRQMSASEDVDHSNLDSVAILSKDGQTIDCKVGPLPPQSSSKLSPVTEVTSANPAAQNEMLIQLSSPYGGEGPTLQETTTVSGVLPETGVVDQTLDADTRLISVLEQCSEDSALLPVESTVIGSENELGVNRGEDFGFPIVNIGEPQASSGVEALTEPQEAKDETVPQLEKPGIKNRITITHVDEDSLAVQGHCITLQDKNCMGLTPSMLFARVKEGRLLNGDAGEENQAEEGAFQGLNALHWIPRVTGSTQQNRVHTLSAQSRGRHRSDSSSEYEMPESNQSTVNSMTPLLTSGSSSDYIHEFSAHTGDMTLNGCQDNVTSVV